MKYTFKAKREQCETCIFLPGNVMGLRPGRLASMVRDCREKGSYIVCHETLESYTGGNSSKYDEAMCRGYLDTGAVPQLYRVAKQLNMLEEVD